MKATRRRPRQADVAALAGVSPATVSLVLNNRTGGSVRISAETRRRVLEAITQLGYVADPVARSLAGGQNGLMGVFTFEALFPLRHHSFYYPFLVGIEEEAERLGYDLLLFTSAGGADGHRHIYRSGVNRLRLADGAVLLGLEQSKDEVNRLLEEGYPFVFVGRRDTFAAPVSFAAAAYAEATAEAVAYLAAYGHRRIAYLGQRTDTESARDRRSGYRQGLAAAGLSADPALFYEVADDETANAVAAERLDAWRAAGVTAVLTEVDRPLDGLLAAARAAGLAIPADLSLVLLGDIQSEQPRLDEPTTFAIPRREMGAAAVRLLIEVLAADGAVRQVTLPCTFVPGSTVAAPRPAA